MIDIIRLNMAVAQFYIAIANIKIHAGKPKF